MTNENNTFYFNPFGDINLIAPQHVLGLTNIIYLLAATILQYCNLEEIQWAKDKYSEGEVHYESEIKNGFDKQLNHYVNWADGCILNNTLYSAAKFLRDLEESIVINEKQRALSSMSGECGYIGVPIHNIIDKYALEIIPDALEAFDEYQKEATIRKKRKQTDQYYWCRYNDEYNKLFKIKQYYSKED